MRSMRFQSLKSKLLLSVSALVIFSVMLVSLLIIQRYSRSLRDTMVAQSENLAHAMALAAADMILINDLVALQRLLDMQKKTHPDISYIFIQRDDFINLIANLLIALKYDHVSEATTIWYFDYGIRFVSILIRNILHKQ